MDTKEQLLELIRELGEATVMAAHLAKNIDYLANLGNDITPGPGIEALRDQAQDLRCKIDHANFEIISDASKY